jgi:hypothetical protein
MALWKKKSDEFEVRLIQNNAFLGELGDLEVRGWYFLKNNFSATSGSFWLRSYSTETVYAMKIIFNIVW